MTHSGDLLAAGAQAMLAPLRQAAWTEWRDFWLRQILDDRYVVCFFLPGVLLLRALPPRWLAPGIIVSGLLFLGWAFGAGYALLWLLLVVGLYRLSGRLEREFARTDVWRGGPVLAAVLIIGGGYAASMFLWRVGLPAAWCAALAEHAPWMLPLGLRGLSFEPDWRSRLPDPQAPVSPLIVFLYAHNIGTAYLAVRMLMYLSDLRAGRIAPGQRGLMRFAAWLCYAPNLMQGPLERYGDFWRELDNCHAQRSAGQTLYGLWRIALGLAKSVVSTLYVAPVVIRECLTGRYYDHPEQISSALLLYGGVFLHIFWLYLEFSGYCDVSAGMGRLLGYRQVENFRRPWLATSLRDFWRRWHISLSFAARDYVYIPLGGSRRHHWRNLIIVFVLIGLWHAPLAQLAAWGVIMGGMVGINHLVHRRVEALRAQPQRPAARALRLWLRMQPLPRICGWALTQHAFLLSLLAFFGGAAVVRVPLELGRRLLAALTAGG